MKEKVYILDEVMLYNGYPYSDDGCYEHDVVMVCRDEKKAVEYVREEIAKMIAHGKDIDGLKACFTETPSDEYILDKITYMGAMGLTIAKNENGTRCNYLLSEYKLD